MAGMNKTTLRFVFVGITVCFIILVCRLLLYQGFKGLVPSESYLSPIHSTGAKAVSILNHNQVKHNAETENVIKQCELGSTPSHGLYGLTNQIDIQHILAHKSFLMSIPLDVEYGSHLFPLALSILATKGPIFELGTGLYSTATLHNISEMQSRQVLSADTDATWLVKYIHLATASHHFRFVPVYSDSIGCFNKNSACKTNATKWDSIGNQPWSVVFVDHRPGERRKVDIVRFRCLSEIVVVHDWEELSYGYSSVLKEFRYRFVFRTWRGEALKAHTALLSNYFNVTIFGDVSSRLAAETSK